MRVDAERGLQSVEKFGWGDKTQKILAMLKHKEARYYLIVTDVNGDQVSIEIQDPRQMTLRSGDGRSTPTAANVRLPIVALEVEIPDAPPFAVLENAVGTMYVQANAAKPKPEPKPDMFQDMLAAKKLLDNDATSPTYYLPTPKPAEYPPPMRGVSVDVFYDDQRWIYTHMTTWNKGKINETRYTKQISQHLYNEDPPYWETVFGAPDFGDGPVGRDTPPPQ